MNDRRRMLVDLTTGISRPPVAQTPVASSSQGPWTGILFEQLPPTGVLELTDVASPEPVMIVSLAPQKSFHWKDADGSRELRMTYGQIHILPAMYAFSMSSRQSGNLLSVAFEPHFLRCAAHDLFKGPTRLELKHQVPADDPLLREMGLALKREVDAGYPGGRVYGESIATSMAHHLVCHYSNATPASQPQAAHRVRPQIRRAVEFIHDRYASEISLAMLATEADLSPFHFARLFKESTGLAPHQYIVQCRVERARELLAGGSETAAEIATTVGFCDQSHLTTHFKRAFGLTPKKFRQQAVSRRSA